MTTLSTLHHGMLEEILVEYDPETVLRDICDTVKTHGLPDNWIALCELLDEARLRAHRQD